MGRKTIPKGACHKFLFWRNADPEQVIDKAVRDRKIAGMCLEDHKRGFVGQIRFFDEMEPRNVIDYARRMFAEFDAVLYYKDGKLDVLECRYGKFRDCKAADVWLP